MSQETYSTESYPQLEGYRSRRVMETVTGQHLFNQKLDMQMLVYKALVKQHLLSSLTTLPGLSGEPG
jgi:hypothetical protein